MRPVWQRRAEEVASLVNGMHDPDRAVSGPCADRAEKISSAHPELLAPHKRRILRLATTETSACVRWHVVQILPRLPLNMRERAVASEILLEYVNDVSALVKTFAMQSLADLSACDARLAATVVPLLEHLTENGTAAMRARGRKLLAGLRRPKNSRRPASRRPRN